MRLRYLWVYALTGLCLAGGELLLELRARSRGYATLLFGETDAQATVMRPSVGGSDVTFYPPGQPPVAPDDALSIWLASASYAADTRHPPDRIFAALVEDSLERALDRRVQVLNASAGGHNIVTNTRDLQEAGARWRPDLTILYQLTNDLHIVTRAVLDPNPGPSSVQGPVFDPSAAIHDWLGQRYESTTLYAQLRANFTPLILDERLVASDLPPSADSLFVARVRQFIVASRASGARPVLSTLAASHLPTDELPRARRFWMLRWNPDLAPEGYVRTLDRWNGVLRTVAVEEDIPLIDMAAVLGGRAELFRDLVHLTREGHEKFAAEMAGRLQQIIEESDPPP